MAYSAEQLASCRSSLFYGDPDKPWKIRNRSTGRKFLKKALHRRERQRVRNDIDCLPEYKRYEGYEY